MKKIFIFVALCMALPLQAATIVAGSWTTAAKVTSIAIYGVEGSSPSYRITTDTVDVTSTGCASSNGAYWWWSADPAAKETYSMILAAYAAGKKITVTFTNECNNSATRIHHIIIVDN